MPYATLDALRSDLGKAERSAASAAYAAKMLHPVPESRSVDRTAFLLERCAGQVVLEFGASGPLHAALEKAATKVYGVDLVAAPGVQAFDLDDVSQATLPAPADVTRVVCGELLEHLSNPGWFLARLRRAYRGVPVFLTVPNAFSDIARRHITTGTENVNKDHVAWFSHRTLTTLLGRVGYEVREHYWYNGPPYLAEGLIVVTE